MFCRKRLPGATLIVCVLPAITFGVLIDANWKDDISGNGSDPTKWDIGSVPSINHYVHLPLWDGNNYTVTVDGTWHIGDLDGARNATVSLGSYTLTVDNSSSIDGTLDVRGGEYRGDEGTESLSTASTSKIIGYGTIGQRLTGDDGEIRAQGGTLSVYFVSNSHNNAHIYVENGAALHIRNEADLSSHDDIYLLGGTLSGPASNAYSMVNEAGELISGRGVISNHKLDNYGTLTVSGGTLTLSQGFLSTYNYGAVNIESGAVLSLPNHSWGNYGTVTMKGGSITGQTMNHNAGVALTVQSGTNNIQNFALNNNVVNVGTTAVATLTITGTGTLNGYNITEGAYGGYFNVGTGALVQGRGIIYPDVTVNGTLAANSSGNTLAVNGALNVQSGRSAYATGGGTLNLANAVYNRGSVYANSGTANVTGTIKAGTSETGGFLASSGSLNLGAATVESNARNTFIANTGGTVTLWANPSTGNLYQTEAFLPRGGILTIGSGQTLTNSSGKVITGYGTLLGEGRFLNNQGVIEANGGTFDVHGDTTNTGTMRAASGYTLNVGSTLTNGNQIYASASSTVNLNSADLTNNGSIYTNGSNALITVADTTPQGSGSFTAATGGTVRFASGFTNANLSQTSPLLLVGGTITVAAGSMTNAPTKSISGNGRLLDSGTTLINEGTVAASGGGLSIQGNVSNSGLVAASGSYSMGVSESLTNSAAGIVRSAGGAAVNLGGVVNAGTIEVVNGGGTGIITFGGKASGAGLYSLQNGRMLFRQGLVMPDGGRLADAGVPSTIEVSGNLGKQGSAVGFDADQINMWLYSPGATIPFPKSVDWQAQDMGQLLLGLDNNLAIGHLTFGDGEGLPGSDLFILSPLTTIYCYGLTIHADADVDLGGRTIYYLRAGVVHNGILGTGFENFGNYANGEIVELVPSKGDFDADGDVDLTDFARFQACFNGPNRPPKQVGCEIADFEPDSDVDMIDFTTFQACFNGPNRPPKGTCP